MKACAFVDGNRLRTALTPGARWFEQVQLWRPDDPDVYTTGDVETAVLLLSGTFDLAANETAWPARGARQTPFAGRPMAVFLPPKTGFRTGNGRGEILMISARQPVPAAQPEGRAALSQKPLLPMAGSGKSYDPLTGEWRPAETFSSAAESLPPRRFERLQVGDVAIERVFAESYKAATLSLDEAVIPAGGSLRLGDIAALPDCDEVLLLARSEHSARIEHGGAVTAIDGDSVHWLAAEQARDVCLHASDGACYVVLAYAGKQTGGAASTSEPSTSPG